MAEEEVEPSVPAFSGHRYYRQWGRTGRRWPVFSLTPEYVSYLKTLPPVAYIDAMEEADHFLRYKNRKAGLRESGANRAFFSSYRPFYGDISGFQESVFHPSIKHSSGYAYDPHTHRPKYYH